MAGSLASGALPSMDQGRNKVAGHIFRYDPMLTTFQGARCEAILISLP
jgi:hypothetical protein